MDVSLPTKAQILVVGGGPAGSYAASALAREGFEVVLLDAARFPRYHIGESMIPSIRPFLRFIDVEDTVKTHGFCVKPGAALKLSQEKKEGYTDFRIDVDPEHGVWNVLRSEFDEILLRHAEKSGTSVFEEIRVTSIEFAASDPTQRPVAAKWEGTKSKSSGTIAFDFLVDASGRAGIMSQRYLKNRRINDNLKNVASWGYWTGCGSYMPGNLRRSNAPWFEANTAETGWNWFIPLHNGTTSVGVVMNQEASVKMRQAAKEANGGQSVSQKEHYLECLKLTPGVLDLIGDGNLVDNGMDPPVQAASDFSYSASFYAGDHYRLVGDAAAFIDPFFSSGVHLALTDGLSAAVSIASSIRGDFSEEDCVHYHDIKVGTAYTRFLLVVMSAYKQMRSQNAPVLSDINEDNFDKAFDLIRPIIQGDSETGRRLTEDEVQKTMVLCMGVFGAHNPDMFAAVGRRIDPSLLALDGPIITPDQITEIVGPDDREAIIILSAVNARKPVESMYSSSFNFSREVLDGFSIVAERGSLRLTRSNGRK